MSFFKNLALQIQKKAINGPFQRVRYIDPYPQTLLKTPSFATSNILYLCGITSLPFSIAIAWLASIQKLPPKLRHEFTVPLHALVHSGIDTLAPLLQTHRIEALGLLISTLIFMGFSCIFAASRLTHVKVMKNWKQKCRLATAKVLDHEIAEVQITSHSRHDAHSTSIRKPTKGYILRIQAGFEVDGTLIEATPSVVNRLSPGTVAQYFKTPEACEALLNTYQADLSIEYNPDNPLDCEIKGSIDRLMDANRYQWLYLLLFGIAIFGFGELFVTIYQNAG